MYVHTSSLNLATNASCSDQNLALFPTSDPAILSDTLAVLHENFVNVIPVNSSTRRSKYIPLLKNEGETAKVKQVKWLELDGVIYFIVLSTQGLQIYDSDITKVVYYHVMREAGDQKSYSIGCCVINNRLLCVGTHLGTVWLFEPIDNGKDFKTHARTYAHDESIVLLESSGVFMVSASDCMNYLWKYNERGVFDIIRKFDVPGLHAYATCVKFKFKFIVIGYSSGEFCVYDLKDEDFCIRNPGHMLKISAVDFSGTDLIVTVSPDCFIKLWKLDTKGNNVSPLQSIYNEEGPLHGVAFLNHCCTEFCVVTAGDTKVKMFLTRDEDVKVAVNNE